MKSPKRAQRRQHESRLKAKRKHYCNAGEGNAADLGKVYHSPCLCSCWMCGNQRKHHGIGIQERRSRELYC